VCCSPPSVTLVIAGVSLACDPLSTRGVIAAVESVSVPGALVIPTIVVAVALPKDASQPSPRFIVDVRVPDAPQVSIGLQCPAFRAALTLWLVVKALRKQLV
jgi:hypothetical protein